MIPIEVEKEEAPASQPAPEAVEKRAKMQGWDFNYRTARSHMAAVLKDFRKFYRGEMPQSSKIMIWSARMQMMQALIDCRTLDLLREERGLLPMFVASCTEFGSQRARDGIHCRAAAELNALRRTQKSSATSDPLEDAEKMEWRFTLGRIRESLRDGRGVDFVLDLHFDSIRSWLSKGKGEFFEELGHLLRKHRSKPLERSLADWILRAWLPLCLWECVTNKKGADKDEAHMRFCIAADLLGLDYLQVHTPKFYHQFVTAWNNVRSKTMKLQGKILVKSSVPGD